jgi:O-antigen ligase
LAIAPALQVEATTLQRLSFTLLIAFLFMMFSRVFDVALSWLHVPGISFRLMGIFLVISGSFLPAFRDSIGKYMLGFTGWFFVAIPFSQWRTGSIDAFANQWLVGFVVFAAAAALVPDFRQYVRTTKTVAFAILVLTAICLVFGDTERGRLFLVSGRFANPNEMAQALLLGLPFWWAWNSNSKSLFVKLISLGSLGLMLYVIGRTGSRGALVSIIIIGAFMFLRASLVGKVKLLVMGIVLFAIVAITLPQSLRARYETFFRGDTDQAQQADSESDQSVVGSAVASTTKREELFKRSLILTLQHPLFGVGPAMFTVAEDSMARAEGKRHGSWLGTHNTFTQVSSECGIPGFLFYCAVVVAAFKKSYSLYRQTKDHPQFKEISTHALALNYALIAFIATGMFLNGAYTSLLPILAGLTVSLMRTAAPLLAAMPHAQPVAPVFAPPARRRSTPPRLSLPRPV